MDHDELDRRLGRVILWSIIAVVLNAVAVIGQIMAVVLRHYGH